MVSICLSESYRRSLLVDGDGPRCRHISQASDLQQLGCFQELLQLFLSNVHFALVHESTKFCVLLMTVLGGLMLIIFKAMRWRKNCRYLSRLSMSLSWTSRRMTIGCWQGLAFSSLRKYGLHADSTTYWKQINALYQSMLRMNVVTMNSSMNYHDRKHYILLE